MRMPCHTFGAAVLRASSVVLVLAVAMGCGSDPDQGGRLTQPESTSNQSMTADALTFGGIVLPPSATVLGVRGDKGIDQLYVLAIAVDRPGIDVLLTGSGFTKPLQPGRRVRMSPVAGFDPDNGTDIASAQDRRTLEGAAAVSREVLVDLSDPQKPVVHWWLFTT